MAATDVLTLAEAKTAINQSGPTHDGEIALWVSAVSRRLDDLCGPVVIRTVTDEKHDGGGRFVQLRYTPCSKTSATEITTAVEYDGTTERALTAETNAEKPTDGFLFDQTLGLLYRRSGNIDARFAAGRLNVVVTYQGGRYADTASVDERFKLTAGAILRRLWQREQGAWSTGGDPFTDQGTVGFFRAMSDSVVTEFLSDELKPPVSA